MPPIFQVNAFSDCPFAGNPAAVCLLDRPAGEEWMQAVAREMNLSETAFLYPGENSFHLRWFTPKAEVALCGHATLASAYVLWREGRLAPDETAVFYTLSGVLTASRQGDLIELDFPAKIEEPAALPPGLDEALGAVPLYIGRNQFDYLVEVDSEDTVRALQPDFARLAALPVRGVIVTSRGREFDFVSRFFAPAVGVNEDPVTGSAHCCLGPFWQKRLGRDSFTAYQASPRGGIVRVACRGERVQLAGQAVLIWQGELLA